MKKAYFSEINYFMEWEKFKEYRKGIDITKTQINLKFHIKTNL